MVFIILNKIPTLLFPDSPYIRRNVVAVGVQLLSKLMEVSTRLTQHRQQRTLQTVAVLAPVPHLHLYYCFLCPREAHIQQ